MTFKKMQGIKFLIEANFYISAIVLIVGGFLSISDHYSFFEFNEDLYGAMHNNLRMMMVYLAFTELVILSYCFWRKNYQILLLVGFFLILMIGSMSFYGEVNTVEIDTGFPMFFIYTGLSHILFGGLAMAEKSAEKEQREQLRKLSK